MTGVARAVPSSAVSLPGRPPPRPLRILLALPGYPPVVGGAEVHASRLAGALRRLGHQVHVLTIYTPPMPAAGHWRDPVGIPVTAIGRHLPPSWRPRAFVAAVARRVLLPRAYDVVHCLLPGLHNVTALLAARARGTASLVMYGGPGDIARVRQSPLGRLQLRTIRWLADRVIVLSNVMGEDFAGLGVPPERLAFLPCGFDPAVFAPAEEEERRRARQQYGLAPEDFVVVSVGRLVPDKRFPVLLQAFAAAAALARGVRLLIAGDGPEREPLESMARSLRLGGVDFLGARPNSQIAGLLAAGDVFALASSSEGLPCALVEAMACGLPCVITDIPGMRQLIEPYGEGLVVPVDDAAVLSEALLALRRDRALARRLGRSARERALRDYTLEAVARRHIALYRAAASP